MRAKRLANGSEVFSPLARNMNEYMNEVNIRYEYYDILRNIYLVRLRHETQFDTVFQGCQVVTGNSLDALAVGFECNGLTVMTILSKGMSDDELIAAMLHPDVAIAMIARRIYNDRHKDDRPLPEPQHCEFCFEGCERCGQ